MEQVDNNYYVYMHRNLVNNKVYIGITKNIERRWHANGIEYVKRGHLFGQAVKKYGWDSFEHIIIHEGLSEQTAYELEKYYIAIFRSNVNRYKDPAYGYNLTDGGESMFIYERTGIKNPFYGKHHSKEARDLISKHRTGKCVGVENHNYGIPTPDLVKSAISESLKKWFAENDSPHNIPVLCVTDGLVFKSAKEADIYYGASKGSVSACCCGQQKTACGRQFTYDMNGNLPKYKNEGKIDGRTTEERKQRCADIHSIPIICIETGQTFKSAKDAARYLKHPNGNSSISKSCRNGTSAYGFHWAYL